MIYARPGTTFTATAEDFPAGLVGTLTVAIRGPGHTVQSAATTAGIYDDPPGSENYSTDSLVAPDTEGSYRVYWLDPDSGLDAIEELAVVGILPSPYDRNPLAEPYYATAAELRAKVDMTAEQLPDDEATTTLIAAEDLIDARLGVRPVDPDSGRKIIPADWADETWRLDKLAGATVEVAANLFRDPGVESRQRARSVSGDVTTSGVYGPAYGERAEALLDASGLRVNTARTRGGRKPTILGRFV